MALTNGQINTHRRIEICKRSYDVLVNVVKFPAQDIILTKYFSVATGMDEHKINALDFSGTNGFVNLPCLQYFMVS
jgi:5-methyltetrahydrofolate--homocysteine methyltransferase